MTHIELKPIYLILRDNSPVAQSCAPLSLDYTLDHLISNLENNLARTKMMSNHTQLVFNSHPDAVGDGACDLIIHRLPIPIWFT